MDENLLRKEIESLLHDAENYLMHAKSKKGKEVRNFEGILAFEYAIKAKNKSKTLKHREEFYESVNRRAEIVLEELKKLQVSLRKERSYEESRYEAGDVAGG